MIFWLLIWGHPNEQVTNIISLGMLHLALIITGKYLRICPRKWYNGTIVRRLEKPWCPPSPCPTDRHFWVLNDQRLLVKWLGWVSSSTLWWCFDLQDLSVSILMYEACNIWAFVVLWFLRTRTMYIDQYILRPHCSLLGFSQDIDLNLFREFTSAVWTTILIVNVWSLELM